VDFPFRRIWTYDDEKLGPGILTGVGSSSKELYEAGFGLWEFAWVERDLGPREPLIENVKVEVIGLIVPDKGDDVAKESPQKDNGPHKVEINVL